MKKLNILFVSAAFAAIFAACDTENTGEIYTPGNEAASFPYTQKTQTFSVSDATYSVPVYRGNKQGAVELPVNAEYDQTALSVPAAVSFADGAGEGTLTVTLGNMVVGRRYTVRLSIDSTRISPAGIAVLTLALTKEFEFENIGIGLWTDGIISYLYGVDPLTYEVTVQKAKGTEGIFRVLNPYGLGVYAYTEAGDVTKNPCYLMIDASDPNAVFIEEQSIGIDYGNGEWLIGSLEKRNMPNLEDEYPSGVLKDNVIDFGTIYARFGSNPYIIEAPTYLELP
jgi:hypothetical protein